MPRCYPSEPDFAEDRRAERQVWEALRDQLPPEAALFHSVALLEREREQEIDLLVAWPGVGLAVIEVKGGHVTRDGQGWHQESQGQRRKIGSPVLQAEDGKKVLARYLSNLSATSAGRARNAHVIALASSSGWCPAPCCSIARRTKAAASGMSALSRTAVRGRSGA